MLKSAAGLAEPVMTICCDFCKLLSSCLPRWEDADNCPSIACQIRRLCLDRVSLLEKDSGKFSGIIKSLLPDVEDFLNRFSDLTQLFQISNLITKTMVSNMRIVWSNLYISGLLIPQLKNEIIYYVARHFNSELPGEPPVKELRGKLFPKPFRVFLGRLRSGGDDINQKRVKYKKKNLFLINSFYQGWKKCFLPMDLIDFDRTLVKHKTNLCDRVSDVNEKLLFDISRIVGDLLRQNGGFKSFKKEFSEDVKLLPSNSSTQEENRANSGSFGLVVKEYYQLENDIFDHNFAAAVDRDYLSTLAGYCSLKGDPLELRTYGPTSFELKECEQELLKRVLAKPPECVPNGVYEPMKIRMITKPSYEAHLSLKVVQKRLLSFLGKFSFFKIPVDSERANLLDYISPVILNNYLEFPDIVSGDYSAATDMLESDVSSTVLDEVLKCMPAMPAEMQIRLRESLLRTTIDYSEAWPKKVDPLFESYEPQSKKLGKCTQRNGQLMGHILSFPILCLANYACWHVSLERYMRAKLGRNIFLSVSEASAYLPVQINGDDILFRSNALHYQIWKKTCSEFGFVISVGKNLVSRDICQINSQMFRIDYYHRKLGTSDAPLFVPKGITYIPYYNFGLLLNRHKGSSKQEMKEQLYPDLVHWKNNRADRLGPIGLLDQLRLNYQKMYIDTPDYLRGIMYTMQVRYLEKMFSGVLPQKVLDLSVLPYERGGFNFFEMSEIDPDSIYGFFSISSMIKKFRNKYCIGSKDLKFQIPDETNLSIDFSSNYERQIYGSLNYEKTMELIPSEIPLSKLRWIQDRSQEASMRSIEQALRRFKRSKEQEEGLDQMSRVDFLVQNTAGKSIYDTPYSPRIKKKLKL